MQNAPQNEGWGVKMKITIKQFNDSSYEYFNNQKGLLRYGQFFCNKFNIDNWGLFYEEDTVKARRIIVGQYLNLED